jgi:hypothetical protein
LNRRLFEAFEPAAGRGGRSLNESFLCNGSIRLDSENPDGLASLFQMPGAARGAMRFGAHRTAPAARGTLGPLGRNTPSLRLNSSLGSLRLMSRETFMPRSVSSGEAFVPGSATATFTSSSFLDGMFNLSTGASFGGRSMAGSRGSAFGGSSMSGASTGPKRSGPSVALKLTF